MPAAPEELASPIIIGRSSSHFTRIFAAELRIDCAFQVVRDLMSSDPGDYGGNPALRIPVLQTPQGTWFGALNVCRELWRRYRFCQQFATRASARETAFRFDT
jgi:hypothetical protein